jgi:CBS-domain-containing membrane protein
VDKRVEDRTVRDVMTRTPKTVRPETDVRTLKAMFESHDFNAFPVVDEEAVLLGMVTKLDFLRMFRPDRGRWIPDVRTLWAERVEEIMTRVVVTVTPGDRVATAIDLMVQSGLRSLPVVERRSRRDVLVGIVSRSDVLRSLVLEGDASD